MSNVYARLCETKHTKKRAHKNTHRCARTIRQNSIADDKNISQYPQQLQIANIGESGILDSNLEW